MSKQAQSVVVSVAHRRSPEAKFPAAWDDSLAVYKRLPATLHPSKEALRDSFQDQAKK